MMMMMIDDDDDDEEGRTCVGMLLEEHPRSRGSGKSLEDVWEPRMVLQITSREDMQYSFFQFWPRELTPQKH